MTSFGSRGRTLAAALTVWGLFGLVPATGAVQKPSGAHAAVTSRTSVSAEAGSGVSIAAEPTRPNVLIYVTDDQRYDGTMGVMPKTRELFGAGGVRFTRGFVTTPLCGPSRVSIMTGQYTHNHGVTCNGPRHLVLNLNQAMTLQHHLQVAGYRTALVGKYLNLWGLERNPPFFDRWSMSLNGAYNNVKFNRNGVVENVPGYSTDVMAGEVVKYLQDFQQDDDSRPWMMFVAPTGAHSPYFAAPRHSTAPVPAWRPPPSATETELSDKPPLLREQTPDLAMSAEIRSKQLRTLMSIDDLVARVDGEMVRLGEENTLSVFTSDNGFLWGDHNIIANKRLPYEPSQRVPLYMRWPGHIAPGGVDDRLVANIDIMPTVLQATGTNPPASNPPLDGRSLLGSHRRPRVHLEFYKSRIFDGGGINDDIGTWASTRGPAYQYTEWYGENGGIVFREYYDLARDPHQLTNLLGDGNSSNNPDIAPLHTTLVRDHVCRGATCP